MTAVNRVAVDRMGAVQQYPMLDPHMLVTELSIKGHAVSTGAPYDQSFVLFFHSKGGKLWRYREYWNPMVTVDALGGREAWAEGFGSPDPSRDSWGS